MEGAKDMGTSAGDVTATDGMKTNTKQRIIRNGLDYGSHLVGSSRKSTTGSATSSMPAQRNRQLNEIDWIG
jgi:hypothetical protein